MRRLAIMTVIAGTLLAGCGANPAVSPSLMPSGVSSLSRQATAQPLDQASYKKGIAAGLAKLQSKSKAPGQAIGSPAGVDPSSYAVGYSYGLIQGSLNSYNRISGSFDAAEWRSFADMVFGAMQDAQRSLKANPQVASRYGLTIGILTGGIQSYASLSGSFNSEQWKSFAESNRRVLEQALQSMQQQQDPSVPTGR